MSDQLKMESGKSGGSVECLGMTFPSEDARRDHFLNLLTEKLKDPAFRALEGFPKGTDEAILAMSDPPYYTACPNPWLNEFVALYGTAYEGDTTHDKKPFASDVSEGKNNPVYLSHSYHTKVPHRAIMRYILHYTNPGDVVLDVFCGTGMTGVAAQLCGDQGEIRELGYRVENGTLLAAESEEGKPSWVPVSRIGARKAILNDLSPAATFIANSFNTRSNVWSVTGDAKGALARVQEQVGWMFQTLHNPSSVQVEAAIEALSERLTGLAVSSLPLCKINYVVWSDVFICPECTNEIVFWDAAVEETSGQVKEPFSCPHCGVESSKRSMDRAWESKFDPYLGEQIRQIKQVPVHISYKHGKSKYSKKPDKFDFALLEAIESASHALDLPVDRIPEGDEARRNDDSGITHVHHFFITRNLVGLAGFRKFHPHLFNANNLTSTAMVASKLYRFRSQNGSFGAGGGPMSGTLYIPSLIKEIPITKLLKEHIDKYSAMRGQFKWSDGVFISTSSATTSVLGENSIDYIFIDPPFGSNIQYADLNFLWESLLRVFTSTALEAVESKKQRKTIRDYRHLMTAAFQEAYRVLKPGRWMTVEFSNTQAVVWNAIQTAIQEAGFVVANVSALDKKQGSFKAVNTTTAVKQDLVISAYKPDAGLEERFGRVGALEDSVWDFVRTHLGYLPSTKTKAKQLEYINERDPRIIYDRVIAWFIRHNQPVPLSSNEFQEGLRSRFPHRDGMVFLSEQVAEYDRRRAQVSQAPQMEMFIADERSAIDWLTDFLKRRPSSYQELHPEFMTQLGAGWKKHETRPELAALLEDNFLRYDGSADVPSQIHTYLSSNFHDLRNLEKSDARLKAKAKDRWFVPDPNKAQDLEKKREKALLKEFEEYRNTPGRKLKEFRLEVLRAGFKAAWANKDYQTIVSIANKVPEDALQEDEKLLFWYDSALTRTGG